MRRAAIYNRVSTAQQDPRSAMGDLRAAAVQRGYNVELEIAETGSGARNDRPGLQRLLTAARKGKIDAVLVTRLDRFGRSTLDLLTNIRALTDAGVRFTCTEQSIDMQVDHDAMSKLVLDVLAGVAEFERAIIRARVVEGQRRAKARGKHIGRPFEGGPSPDAVAKLRSQGMSWAQIATRLGCTSMKARRRYAQTKGRSP